MIKKKRCSKCGETKPLSEFHLHRGMKDGRYCWCKACRSVAMRKARTEYPDSVRVVNLKSRYKLTPDDYEDLLCRCNARCEICGMTASEHKKKTGRFLAVDHDHQTGAVRGILCGWCNMELGKMETNPKLMTKEAAVYLLEYYRRAAA